MSTGDSQSLSLARLIRLIFFTIQLFIFGALANIWLCLSLLIMPFNAQRAYDLNSWVAGALWGWMQHVFEYNRNGNVIFRGDQPVPQASAFVIANHQTYADFYLIHALSQRAGMLGRTRYFAKDELKWLLPVFGWSMWAVGMIMVKRNWSQDATLLNDSFRRFTKNKQPVWIVSYLEGTRKTSAKIAASQKWCQEHAKPVLREVLWPRTKGFVAAINELRGSSVQYIYDLTLVYDGPLGFHQPPDLVQIHSCPDLASEGWKFHIDVRKFPISDLPYDENELLAWVEAAFVRKDQLIRDMRSASLSDTLGRKGFPPCGEKLD